MMGLDFIDRTLKTTGIVLLICLPFGLYYFGVYPTLAFFSGGIWGMLNLIFLSHFIRTVIKPGKIDIKTAVGLGIIKFPLLYASGYFLIKIKDFEPWHLLMGFSLFLAVMVLKVLGRVILGLEDKPKADNKLQGAL